MRAILAIALLAIALVLVFALQTGDGGNPPATVPGTDPYGTGAPPGEALRGEPGRVEVVQEAREGISTDATVSGRVLDASSGGSLAGARVWLQVQGSETVDGNRMVETAGAGGFVLPLGRVAGAGLVVVATREGYLTARRTLRGRDFGDDGHVRELDLALWPLQSTGSITGRAVAGDGSSLTGSIVTVREQDGPTRSPESGDPSFLAVPVDATGRFEVAPLPPGTHDLEVECEGFATSRLSAISVPEGSATDVGAVVLLRGVEEPEQSAVLFGTVLDADGQPVDAAVEYDPGMTDTGRVEVDDHGAYELHLPPGDRRALAIEVTGQPIFRFERTFEPGERVEYHHRVASGDHFIGGVVVDGARPVTELLVWCALAQAGPPGARRGRTELRTTTDDGGRFRLEGIDRDTVDLVLEWFRGSFRNLVIEDLEVDREDHRLHFPVPHQISISGVVLSHDGQPVAGARIAPAFGPSTELPDARGTSEADGSFRVAVPLTNQSALPLEVSKTGYRSASRRLLLREVEAGDSISWNPVLYRDPELAIVRGKITDERGRPVASVQCIFEQLDMPPHTRQRWTAESDSSGSYESPGLFPGRTLVTFRHPERIAVEREVVLAASAREGIDVSLSLPARGRRTVVFVNPDSSPGRDVEYSITCTTVRAHQSGTADIRGAVSLADWPAAQTSITVIGDPRYPQQTTVVVLPPENPTTRLTLRRGDGEIAGRVVSPEGYPVVNEIVVLREREGPGLRVYAELFTGQDGGFRFTNLPDAPFDIDVSNDTRTRREVRPADQAVTLRFPPG